MDMETNFVIKRQNFCHIIVFYDSNNKKKKITEARKYALLIYLFYEKVSLNKRCKQKDKIEILMNSGNAT